MTTRRAELVLVGVPRTMDALFFYLFHAGNIPTSIQYLWIRRDTNESGKFTEPISDDWNTLAQCALFVQNMKKCGDGIYAQEIVASLLEGDQYDYNKDRHMLIGKKFKSDPCLKRIVRGWRSLLRSWWIPKLERLEAGKPYNGHLRTYFPWVSLRLKL